MRERLWHWLPHRGKATVNQAEDSQTSEAQGKKDAPKTIHGEFGHEVQVGFRMSPRRFIVENSRDNPPQCGLILPPDWYYGSASLRFNH